MSYHRCFHCGDFIRPDAKVIIMGETQAHTLCDNAKPDNERLRYRPTRMAAEATSPTMSYDFLMELICRSMRDLPLAFLTSKIRSMEKAESVGPLIHPSAWQSRRVQDMHSANLDVVRRLEDLRRSIDAADAVVEKHDGKQPQSL